MNLIPENQFGIDPFFDKKVVKEDHVKMSKEMLYNLGQLSTKDYENFIKKQTGEVLHL